MSSRQSTSPSSALQHSAELARSLREAPRELDQLTRVRMERALLQAWRVRGGRLSDAERPQPGRARVIRAAWLASAALSAVAGGLLVVHLTRAPRAEQEAGRFELSVEGAVVQSGPVSEAQVLHSGSQGRIGLELRGARLDMQPDSELRLERLSDSELAFTLLSGQLDIDFHPLRRGEQRLRVETRSARVLVVGTRLRVEVQDNGDTRVAVSQGAVDVIARSSARVQRVAAGAALWVRVDDVDDSERAVRETLERRIGDAGRQVAPDAVPRESAAPSGNASASPEVTAVQLETQRARLLSARKLLRQSKHKAARALLRSLTDEGMTLELRVEALSLRAESFTAEGAIAEAAAEYRRADAIAPRHAAGHNARFALGRLLERHAGDREAALSAYRRYLALAPDGALAAQARAALCRLGSAGDCAAVP